MNDKDVVLKEQMRTSTKQNKPQKQENAKPCILIVHGKWNEINLSKFPSIAAAKRYANECDLKIYSIKSYESEKNKKTPFQDKLENAKEKAEEHNNKNNSKSKKHKDVEVE